MWCFIRAHLIGLLGTGITRLNPEKNRDPKLIWELFFRGNWVPGFFHKKAKVGFAKGFFPISGFSDFGPLAGCLWHWAVWGFSDSGEFLAAKAFWFPGGFYPGEICGGNLSRFPSSAIGEHRAKRNSPQEV